MKFIKKLFGRTALNKKNITEDEYYDELFIKNPIWNSVEPNDDEKARWLVIDELIDKYLSPKKADGIIDVGCGRGWLSNKLTKFGSVLGIEPVKNVVLHAKALFPNIEFLATNPVDFVSANPNKNFELVVCSEVLEHVVEKKPFIDSLWTMLRKDGLLVITTPRGELKDFWEHKYGKPAQPVEEWITTDGLKDLLKSAGFNVLETRYAFSDDIYQIHIARRTSL